MCNTQVLKYQRLLPREAPTFVARAAATEAPAEAAEAASAPKEGVAHLRFVKGSADKVEASCLTVREASLVSHITVKNK